MDTRDGVVASRVFCVLLMALIMMHNVVNASALSSDGVVQSKPFTIGIISDKPKNKIKSASPFADYMAGQLTHFGYTHGRVIVTATAEEMIQRIENGDVQLITSTLYSALYFESNSSVELSGLRWKQNSADYTSVIFTRRDSNISELEQLKGKTIVFEKPSSTSAFFLPASHLIANGISLQKLSSISQRPDPDKVGYLFIKQQLNNANELNMSIWVYHKRVEAAAFSHIDWADKSTVPKKVSESLSIVSETNPYPRSLMLTSTRLGGLERLAIQQAMYSAHEQQLGLASLLSFKETTKIEPISHSTKMHIEQSRHTFSEVLALIE